MLNFEALSLKEEILKAVQDMGFTEATPHSGTSDSNCTDRTGCHWTGADRNRKDRCICHSVFTID